MVDIDDVVDASVVIWDGFLLTGPPDAARRIRCRNAKSLTSSGLKFDIFIASETVRPTIPVNFLTAFLNRGDALELLPAMLEGCWRV